jgi:hypothetical protein
MCSHEIIDRDDTLMYTKGYNFLLFDFLTKWVLQSSSSEEEEEEKSDDDEDNQPCTSSSEDE